MEPPISIADFVRLGNFSAAAMSPNGKYLVVTQRAAKEPRDEYSTVVYELAGMKLVSAVRVAERGDVPLRHTWVSDTRVVTTLGREFGTWASPGRPVSSWRRTSTAVAMRTCTDTVA